MDLPLRIDLKKPIMVYSLMNMKNRFFFQSLLAVLLAVGLLLSPLNAVLVVQSARLYDETAAPAEEIIDIVENTSEPASDPADESSLEEAQPSEVVPSEEPAAMEDPVITESTPQPMETEAVVVATIVPESADSQVTDQPAVLQETTLPAGDQPSLQPSETEELTQPADIEITPEAIVESGTIFEETQPGGVASNAERSQMLVKYDPAISLEDLTSRLNELGYSIRESAAGYLVVDVPTGQDVQAASLLQSISGIQSAESVHTASALDLVPNDPAYPSQPNLLTIDAPGGWQYFTGSSSVIVAIIDTGVDLSNPDFAGRLVQGYDFVNNDDVAMDDNGHGTHVAGSVAATGNNGILMAGLDWSAKIMPVKVLNSSGKGSELSVSQGIMYAVDHGATIINLSLGFTDVSPMVAAAVEYAHQHGVTVVAASGNTGSLVTFPASMPDVIAVGAVDNDENWQSYSNYGNALDVVAPGTNVLSTGLSGPIYKTGTSMAAAQVSGLASLLNGIYPLTPAQVKTTIQSSSKDLGTTGWDVYFGSGLIKVREAILQLLAWLHPAHYEEPQEEELPTPVFYPTFTPTPTAFP
jgi:subtilisin family serine protease